ncbi:jg5959 [Pararge aegeria aegeria]|uniref:Jg5959 protein n=1 Tax=Pararge aegeria aegeria TaxID=348720 RepID=A0A8S4RDM7_9NEOP|nr:jg5959 [Pararge aegeria aegeria]
MGRAHRSENRWTLGLKVLEWRPVNAAKVGSQRGGEMTSGESLRAAGGKRPWAVYCGTTKDLCPAVDVDWLK